MDYVLIGIMEEWKGGTGEDWNNGRLERWNGVGMEIRRRNFGMMDRWDSGRRNYST
jgi:hypothetical protein